MGTCTMNEKDRLIKDQAKIRNVQRKRIEQIHSVCHDYELNLSRTRRGIQISKNEQDRKVFDIHKIVHKFLKGFDEAVIIHEKFALIDNRDPSDVNQAIKGKKIL